MYDLKLSREKQKKKKIDADESKCLKGIQMNDVVEFIEKQLDKDYESFFLL